MHTRAAKCGDGGFTIIELLIAFVILAIVSGSLFQIFYVSSQNNAKTLALDTANSIALTEAELFKANPEISGERHIKFYDERWNELPISASAPGAGGAEAPARARYMLESTFSDIRAASMDLNYVSALLTFNLDASQTYRLVIDEHAGEIEAAFNGVPQKAVLPNTENIISVSVNFSMEGVMPKHITVVNRTVYTVNINVFGIPDTGIFPGTGVSSGTDISSATGVSTETGRASDSGVPAGIDEIRGGFIEVSPVSGSVAVMYLNDQIRAADSLMRAVEVTVRELTSGGAELARVRTAKYIPY